MHVFYQIESIHKILSYMLILQRNLNNKKKMLYDT